MRLTGQRRARLVFWTPYALLAVLAVTEPAQAQDETDTDTAAARRFAVDGVKLADSGRCAEAIDKLSRAEKLHHSPIVLERLGECQVEVGKVVEGSESLRKVLREEQPANPSPALTKALSNAQSALAAAKVKIAWLTISVAPDVADAEVSLDGRPVSSALLGDERPVDPGDHLLEATAAGFFKTSASASLAAGEKRAINLKLELDPDAAAPSAAASSAVSESPAPRKHSRNTAKLAPTGSENGARSAPEHSAAYVTWLVSGLAAGTGATFGILAWHGRSQLRKECPALSCPQDSSSKLDQTRLFGNLSTGAFAVSGAGLVLGTILFATSSSSAEDVSVRADALRSTSDHDGVRIHSFIGFEQVGIYGSF